MSGAVRNPFTASMFRFDGVNIQNVSIACNTKCILNSGINTICLFLKVIYFSQTKKSRPVNGGTRWGVRFNCYFFILIVLSN